MTDPDPMLAGYLAGRDVPCPQCAYNLRDLVGGRCPECGDELALRLALSEPRQASLIAGLIGLSAGAGLSGLMLLFLLIVTLRDHANTGADTAFYVVTIGGLLVEGLAIGAWLYAWHPIRRSTTAVRWGLVAGCWALTLANILVFTFNVR